VLVRILIAAAVVLFLVMWARATMDVWRRRDLSNGEKSGWTIIMLLVPFVGLLLYMMMRPSQAQISRRSRS
jgi:hypothetical protein